MPKSLGVENILHLHARRIVIPAMGAGKKIDVTAPLPPHMKNSFKALGIDIPKNRYEQTFLYISIINH